MRCAETGCAGTVVDMKGRQCKNVAVTSGNFNTLGTTQWSWTSTYGRLGR